MTGDREKRSQRLRSRRKAGTAASLPAEKKRIPCRLLLLFLLLFFASAAAGYRYVALYHNPTEVAADAAETGAVRILENCNIRSAPGTDSKVIGGGKKGQIFEYAGKTEVTGEDSKWYSIEYKDTTAWVSEAVAELQPDE